MAATDTPVKSSKVKSNQTQSGLRALFINTSLKQEAAQSHTQLLLDSSALIMNKAGVSTEHLYLREHTVPPGIFPDMREHGHAQDAWPDIWNKVQAANILVVGTPIWLGEESSLCRVLIERLYAVSGELNERGQSKPYGKVGACVVTGNEDGIKHVSMSVLYALNHLGFTIPPQADCGWIGEAGPGPSYGDSKDSDSPTGFDNDFTQRNTTIMSWNCVHLARLLQAAEGFPEEGTNRNRWKSGERFGFQNPPPLEKKG